MTVSQKPRFSCLYRILFSIGGLLCLVACYSTYDYATYWTAPGPFTIENQTDADLYAVVLNSLTKGPSSSATFANLQIGEYKTGSMRLISEQNPGFEQVEFKILDDSDRPIKKVIDVTDPTAFTHIVLTSTEHRPVVTRYSPAGYYVLICEEFCMDAIDKGVFTDQLDISFQNDSLLELKETSLHAKTDAYEVFIALPTIAPGETIQVEARLINAPNIEYVFDFGYTQDQSANYIDDGSVEILIKDEVGIVLTMVGSEVNLSQR